jgi:outer membrane protein with beta-barrel domain
MIQTGRNLPRPGPGLAILLFAIAAVPASAQTVIVRNAPPSTKVEVVFDNATAAAGTTDAAGIATLPFKLPLSGNATSIDARIYVDNCPDVRRVHIVERERLVGPPEENCDRRDISGIFLIKRVTSLVVNVAGANPTLLLRQGSVSLEPERVWSVPAGLIVFGGAGRSKVRDAVAFACGNVSPCDGSDTRTAFGGGATFWLTPVLAGEASYARPQKFKASGSTPPYRFTSSLDVEVLTLAGKVGFPIHHVRPYGFVGGAYHRATFLTEETIDPVTVSVDDGQATRPGGTQSFAVRTRGWGWTFGGGLEAWFSPVFGIYGEIVRVKLKGDPVEDLSQARLSDALTSWSAGVRIHLWR